MAEPTAGRRAVCSACSKPASVCLCGRFKSPPVDNSVAVTVLQHSQERRHPLNSTRIVKLGLKNVSVVAVSDTYFQAHFEIRTMGDIVRNSIDEDNDSLVLSKRNCGGFAHEEVISCSNELKRMNFDAIDCECNDSNGIKVDKLKFDYGGAFSVMWKNEFDNGDYGNPILDSHLHNGVDQLEPVEGGFRVFTSTVTRIGILQKHTEEPSFSRLLASPICKSLISSGFIVKKIQRKQSGCDDEEVVEYDLAIPPGSAVLFPSEKSVSINALDFEVKNLIVLDGTWGKARRICHENPWLKLLPHLRLDVRDSSLYNEVRPQPKAGCLSTVESIVCALKEVGEDCDGLDDLLAVFESMVGDQRRCKAEKIGKQNSMPIAQ